MKTNGLLSRIRFFVERILIFLLFKHKQIKIKNHFIFLMLYLYNLHVSYKFLFSIINLQSYNLLLSRDSDNGL